MTNISEVPNPFKELREAHNLSQYELARRANISKHAVLRLEQGMYSDPLPKMLNYFEEHFPVTRLQLVQQYEAFQVSHRASNPRIFGSFIDVLKVFQLGGSLPYHPFTVIRENVGLNPTAVAKALCINQSVVVYFEKRVVHQQTVPEQLLAAMKDNGYSDTELNYLCDAYQEFRQFYLGKAPVTVPTTPVPTTTPVSPVGNEIPA